MNDVKEKTGCSVEPRWLLPEHLNGLRFRDPEGLWCFDVFCFTISPALEVAWLLVKTFSVLLHGLSISILLSDFGNGMLDTSQPNQNICSMFV